MYTNEQPDERLSTADFVGSAGSNREERSGRPSDTATQYDDVDGNRGEDMVSASSQEQVPLFPSTEAEGFRGRWTSIQSGFVDEPRRAVEQADSLIAEVMKALASSFADERQKLEQQWDRGDDVSTEDLRLGLKRYRSFFDRLLSI
ncbi:MAG TPA: hypothetical protein VNE17_14440 [Nitrolancea sp.]|nr:hypothetical protein [Nitrolancea sp.]